MTAETSTSVKEAETLSDILVLLIIVCVRGGMKRNHRGVCLDAVRADKSAVRGNTEICLSAVVVSSLGLRK